MAIEIPLTRDLVALVDEEDYLIVRRFRWHANNCGKSIYARTNAGGISSFYMHIFIMKPHARFDVDHLNGNGLDNRRENLRVASRSQNNQNQINYRENKTSKYKGVSWDARRKKWFGKITDHRKQIFLGYFSSEIEAAFAYDHAARKIFGEFAACNLTSYRHSDERG